MPTLAKSAYGVKLSISGDDLPELTNLSDVGINVQTIDVTAHDGASGYGSMIPTFLSGGQVRATFNWVPADAGHVALRTAALNRTSVPFVVTLPTTGNPTISFNAFVTQYRAPTMPVNGVLPLECQLTVDGEVVFA